MSKRIDKVNDLVRDNLSRILSKELSLKTGTLVSIVKVDTLKDLRYARVFVSVFPIKERNYIEKTLHRQMYRIQGALNKTLNLKILPRVEFIIDTTQEYAGKLEDIFEKIRKEKGEKD